MAVVTGAAFMHLPDGTSYFPYFERESFSFLCVYFTTIAQLHTIPVFFQDIEILRREVTINLYSPLAYWASTWIVYSTYYFLHSLVFACIAYYLADVSRKIEAFIIFFFALHICGQCAYFLSQYFSATSLSIASASNKFLILVFVDVLFAGYYQDILNMRSWLGSWLPYFSIMRWAYQAMVVIEFQDNFDLPDGQGYIDQLGFESVSAAGSIAILVLMLFVYLTITATVLQNRKY